MDLSIIIVTWNAQSLVAECLQSVTTQIIGAGMEIIVVDNASTDGTPEMICREFPCVRLVRNEENLGFAKANNIGISLAQGDYILLINSDVNVLPGCLAKIHQFLQEHESVGLLGPQMLGRNREIRRSCMRFPTLWNTLCRACAADRISLISKVTGGSLMRDFAHDKLRDVEVLNGWFWATRREALRQVGPLDERFFMYGEDVDWCYRFHAAGWRVVFYPAAQAIHYGGSSSAKAPARFYVEKHKANIQFWRKYHRGYQNVAFAAIMLLSESIRVVGYTAAWVLPWMRKSAEHKIGRSIASLRWFASLSLVRDL